MGGGGEKSSGKSVECGRRGFKFHALYIKIYIWFEIMKYLPLILKIFILYKNTETILIIAQKVFPLNSSHHLYVHSYKL